MCKAMDSLPYRIMAAECNPTGFALAFAKKYSLAAKNIIPSSRPVLRRRQRPPLPSAPFNLIGEDVFVLHRRSFSWFSLILLHWRPRLCWD